MGSWGYDVIAWARVELGLELDRWQQRAIIRALACDADGRLVHRIYLISTARQCGKTVLVRALIGWALTAGVIPPWSMIYGLAHDKGQARLPYRAVLTDLEPIRRRVGPLARGGLALTQYLGIRSMMHGIPREYHLASREARDRLRGESIDLAVFDEVRTQRDLETWYALEPTTTARPMPLILAISTAGDYRSILLRSWWERGRRILDGEPADGFGMTWYAADDGDDPEDPRSWAKASPALADGRLDESAIRSSRASLGPAGFLMERLNLWADAADDWLPSGLWSSTAAEQPDAGGRMIFGVDVTPSWRRFSIAVAIPTSSGYWTGLADELDASRPSADRRAGSIAPAELVSVLSAAIDAWHPASVVVSAASSAAPHVEAVCELRDVELVKLGGREIRAASELFRSELLGGRLMHAEDALLASQSRDAKPSRPIEQGDWYLSSRTSTGDIDAIRACAWAAWEAIGPVDELPRIQLW